MTTHTRESDYDRFGEYHAPARATLTLYADNGDALRLTDNGASIILQSRLGRIETRDIEYVQHYLRQFGVREAPAMLARTPTRSY